MLSFVLALAAAAQADAAVTARQGYSTCLRQLRASSLTRNVAPDAFEAAAAAQCADRATAFEAAMVRRDTGAGVNRAQATEDARGILTDMRGNALEYYRDEYAAAHPAQAAAPAAPAPVENAAPAAAPPATPQ